MGIYGTYVETMVIYGKLIWYIYIYLDLHLALFLLIAVFTWIYARSDFLCSLELENVHLFLDGRAFTLFSRVFTLISRENTLIFLALKCTKCKNAKSGAITLMWRKTAQKAEILQMSIYLCFFEDTGIYMFLISCNLESPWNFQMLSSSRRVTIWTQMIRWMSCLSCFSWGFQTDRAESTLPPVWRWGPGGPGRAWNPLICCRINLGTNFAVSTASFFRDLTKIQSYLVLSSTFFGGSWKQFRIWMSRAIFPGMMSLQTIVTTQESAAPDGPDVGGRK